MTRLIVNLVHTPPTNHTHTVTNRKKEKKGFWMIILNNCDPPKKNILLHLFSGVLFGVNLVSAHTAEFCLYENNMKNNSLRHTDLCRCSESGGQECKFCVQNVCDCYPGTWEMMQMYLTIHNQIPFNFYLYNSQWMWNKLYKWIHVYKHKCFLLSECIIICVCNKMCVCGSGDVFIHWCFSEFILFDSFGFE